ncbi:glycoside hydrolase family 99-like domain-containing protein [Acinetobacter johnsonii]|uniref:glycosyltransferase WbsX family protein n=1 Tax=Acinetobacter johnsonii TaxID=40214 RepID=UPI002447225D|nr:glycoside hydrolase family 99-like domain-containing protein [Acinetobacter johnsonii]MDH1518909.1 glycoside hydrolase family 99-like domain-containing protein [Acinetobacter johnsonii]
MKTFAFYLPQFHAIPENDKWWGKGFTEWVNVKNAKPLFKGHDQPRIPLNNNYYNLLEINTLQWQAEMLNKYKLDGLCIYHYWFSGKKLLEKPTEILLKNASIDIPFFFCWANESWTKTWEGNEKDVLISQSYDETKWKEHFEYLLPFFKDKRYIKENNKPLFVLYRSYNFDRCADWIKLWNKLAIDQGFNGIHFISMNTIFDIDKRILGFDAQLNFEPMNTIGHDLQDNTKIDNIFRKIKRHSIININRIFNLNKVELLYDYDVIWNKILKKEINENIYAGAFVGWDNTPRKKNKGLIVKKSTPEKFEKYFSQLYIKAKESNSPYIFVNAWNEWAEGTYLEPDEVNQYKYLEAIKNVIEN